MKTVSIALTSFLVLLLIAIFFIKDFSPPKNDHQYFINNPDEALEFSNECHFNLLESLRVGDYKNAKIIRNDSECLSAKSVALETKEKRNRDFIENKQKLIQEQKLKEGSSWDERYRKNLTHFESMSWDDFLVIKNDCLSKSINRRDFAICSAVDHSYTGKVKAQIAYVERMSSNNFIKFYQESCENEVVASKDSCYLVANVINRLKQEAQATYLSNKPLLENDKKECVSLEQKVVVFNEKIIVNKNKKMVFCELVKPLFLAAPTIVME